MKSLLSNKGKYNFVKIRKLIFLGEGEEGGGEEGTENAKIWGFGFEIFENNFFKKKSAPSQQDTGKISLRLKS